MVEYIKPTKIKIFNISNISQTEKFIYIMCCDLLFKLYTQKNMINFL